MPKSKNNRKGKKRAGDRRPVPRSGNNEGPADYRTAKPVQEEPKQCPYLDRVATLPNAFTPDECAQIINTALNDWDQRESMIQRDKEGKIEQNFEEDLDYADVLHRHQVDVRRDHELDHVGKNLADVPRTVPEVLQVRKRALAVVLHEDVEVVHPGVEEYVWLAVAVAVVEHNA